MEILNSLFDNLESTKYRSGDSNHTPKAIEQYLIDSCLFSPGRFTHTAVQAVVNTTREDVAIIITNRPDLEYGNKASLKQSVMSLFSLDSHHSESTTLPQPQSAVDADSEAVSLRNKIHQMLITSSNVDLGDFLVGCHLPASPKEPILVSRYWGSVGVLQPVGPLLEEQNLLRHEAVNEFISSYPDYYWKIRTDLRHNIADYVTKLLHFNPLLMVTGNSDQRLQALRLWRELEVCPPRSNLNRTIAYEYLATLQKSLLIKRLGDRSVRYFGTFSSVFELSRIDGSEISQSSATAVAQQYLSGFGTEEIMTLKVN